MKSIHSFRKVSLSLVTLSILSLGLVSQSFAYNGNRGDLGKIIPGQMHVGILVDMPLLIDDFPAVTKEGWIGNSIDFFVNKGLPDPRDLAFELAVGANVSVPRKKLHEALVLGKGSFDLIPSLRKVAKEVGFPIRERAYRGVRVLKPVHRDFPIEAAEIMEDVSLFHLDLRNKFKTTNLAVDTLQGMNQSYGDKHGMSLDSQTYMSLGIRVPILAQEELAKDPNLSALGFVVQGAMDWRKTGTKVQLDCDLETFTSIEAKYLADWLTGKRKEWIDDAENPVLKKFLEAIQVRRVGKNVFLGLKYEWNHAKQAIELLNQTTEETVFID